MNNVYKMCKVLCPLCKRSFCKEIEMLGDDKTAIIWCPHCETFVDGLILKIENEKE